MRIGFGLLAMCLAAAAAEEKDTARHTLEFVDANAARTIEVDNVFGSIDVQGFDGRTVEAVVDRTIRADLPSGLEAAKTEVKLDIRREGGRILFYVDGPFRSRDGTSRRWGNEYSVRYDFVLRVPRDSALRLRTVNKGGIKVRAVRGSLDVKNVNGSIDLEEVAGAGQVSTVNGPIRATFLKSPQADTLFKTINGPVEVRFPHDLAADLALKTFNGGVYTDFEIGARTPPQTTPERRNGRFIYRNDVYRGARIGEGGPELKFETLNGEIRILKRQ
jgi:hypothetical protein